MKQNLLQAIAAFSLCMSVHAQVNSGSDGSDGALNVTANTYINMSDHPDGIYQYTSVNIAQGAWVAFIPNSNNTPVVWLVKSNCVINGAVYVTGYGASDVSGGPAGPGGYRGGNGGFLATAGQGPGGGAVNRNGRGGNASYGTSGQTNNWGVLAGPTYGNAFLVPLVGGSGGGGGSASTIGGAGGGGAILIVTSGKITVAGAIYAYGGGYPGWSGGGIWSAGGGGSGGAIRLVATQIDGEGRLDTTGGNAGDEYGSLIPCCHTVAGNGRIRLDTFANAFSGTVLGAATQGFQPVIIPAQSVSLSFISVAGVTVPSNASGRIVSPDVLIPALQTNPVTIVVRCSNVPMNSAITVTVKPVNTAPIVATGLNNSGTLVSSSATLSLSLPRGGGFMYASAAVELRNFQGASVPGRAKTESYAQTGLTSAGERFEKIEVTAKLGGQQELTYITRSGNRHSLTANY